MKTAVSCAVLCLALAAMARAQATASLQREFEAALARADAAQLELQNGRPDAYKALWSHSDRVTLTGGFGGEIEQGWERVAARLDWASRQFSGGSHRIDRMAADVAGDMAYVVQREHIVYTPPGQSRSTTRDYRVTMVFRRESGMWRIVHRHADAATERR